MDKYTYMALFEVAEEGGYNITFPDLPGCITCGDDLEDGIKMATEALEGFLWCMEEDEEKLPVANKPENIETQKGSFIVPISVYMNLVREEMNNKSVKKTLTIPYWLNKIAEKENINFSSLLQESIKNKLNIKNY